MKNKFLISTFLIFTVLGVVFILTNPYETAFYCSNALKMCATSLIPSLFIYMVLSKIISEASAHLTFSNRFTYLISDLSGLPESLIPSCIFGLFGGAPSGAFAIGNIYSKGLCSKKEAERAAVLSNNCSSSFILGVAGSVTGSFGTAALILISNILTSITVYVLFFRIKTKETLTAHKPSKELRISQIITESISASSEAVLRLCGYVLFFFTFSSILSDRLSLILSDFGASAPTLQVAKSIVSSLFEMTCGVMNAGNIQGIESIFIISFCVSFTGLSVIFQVKNILSGYGISSTPYFISRCLCGIICPIYTLIFIHASDICVRASTTTAAKISGGIELGDVVSLILIAVFTIIGAFVLSCLDKRHKNN